MLKSYKPLTSEQERETWAEIEVQANNAYKGACILNLGMVNDAIFELNKLSKRLQKSQVGKLLLKNKPDIFQKRFKNQILEN